MNDIDTIEVEITYLDGRVGVYEVADVFEHVTSSECYLAMMRLKDLKYGYIPMHIIKSYRILEDRTF